MSRHADTFNKEANQRIDSLTDAEAIRLAKTIEHLPAGGSTASVVVISALIVFLVLLATDIMGYTDVFPFVKHRQR
ncbi:MAG: PA2779 family protein [Desulfobacterales bacterium]|nr:MAG: PA2779 family protein [Desulfobacterales bacterium]